MSTFHLSGAVINVDIVFRKLGGPAGLRSDAMEDEENNDGGGRDIWLI